MSEPRIFSIPIVARQLQRVALEDRVSLLEAEKHSADARIAVLDAARQAAEAKAAFLEAERQSAAARVAELEATGRVAEERIATLEGDCRSAQDRAAALDALQIERDALDAELKRVLEEREALISASSPSPENQHDVETLLQEIQSSSAEREALRLEVSSLREENENLTLNISSASDKIEQYRSAFHSRDELRTCRDLAYRCIFVLGFARSSTTITLEMINTVPNALILGEANFYLQTPSENFRSWYNEQHKGFQNQVTKSSYIPDFVPDRPHTWWEWLQSASEYYEYLGDKIALSPFHMEEAHPDRIQSFYEARFFDARYVFTLRSPIPMLISGAKMFGYTEDSQMRELCVAWLRYMQLWADWVRIFPKTFTIVADDLDSEVVSDLGDFLGLDMSRAALLLDPANKREHDRKYMFPTLVEHGAALTKVFEEAKAACAENQVFWQAEQKRSNAAVSDGGEKPGSVAVEARPLGATWVLAEALRSELLRTATA